MGAREVTGVDAGGRLVDRDAVLAEQFPTLEQVQGESPSAPVQRAARVAWESKTAFDRMRDRLEARARSSLRAQELEADRFIADMEARARYRHERDRVYANRAYRVRRKSGRSALGRAA